MKNTPLHAVHQALGARLVEFGGWHMPVQYASILEEGKRVRQAAGLFDLSHMGRFEVQGPDAVRLVDRVCTNHCAKTPAGAIRYSLLCGENGGPLDDLLYYREGLEGREGSGREGSGVYLVVNASNTERDLRWIRSHLAGLDARVVDRTSEQAMLALQGPRSAEILAAVTSGVDLRSIGYYKFAFGNVCGLEGTRISRTGYTGEDGFEIYFPSDEAERVWRELLRAGKAAELQPIGLGARDILRLEAGMALYGHEIDEHTNPFEAGLAFAIALTPEKGDFVGRAALERLRGTIARRLVGIVTDGPRVPRQGMQVLAGTDAVGTIASGGVSPTLDTNIGSAFVRLGHDAEGRELELDVRGRRQPCTVRELPFYSRTRKKTPAGPVKP